MPYASYHEEPSKKQQPEFQAERPLSTGKALAKIYGYMGIGLLLTALVALGAAWLFSRNINFAYKLELFNKVDAWLGAAIATWIVSLIGVIVLSFVIPIRLAKGGKSIWVPYILYSIFMGALLSAVLLTGISMYIVAEAFGITAAAFGGMFLIGWFSKSDLTPLAYIAMMLLLGVVIVGLIAGITFAIQRNVSGMYWLDLGISAVMVVVILLVTAVDTFRIKKIIEAGENANNVYLYCAYVMYCDFIALLIRVLYILAKTQRN